MVNTILITLGNNIQRLRQSRGETLQELGDALHLTRSAVKNYENAEREPSLEIVAAIAEHYGVTVDELLRGDASRRAETAK